MYFSREMLVSQPECRFVTRLWCTECVYAKRFCRTTLHTAKPREAHRERSPLTFLRVNKGSAFLEDYFTFKHISFLKNLWSSLYVL